MTPDDKEPPVDADKVNEIDPDANKAEEAATQEAASTESSVEHKDDEGEAGPTTAGATPEDFGAAFKSAAQKILEEKLGMHATVDGQVDFTAIDKDKVKENAQEFITGLLGNFAAGLNKAAGPAASDSQFNEAQRDTIPSEADNIIDLGRERQKREQVRREPSELERRISMSVRNAFNEYMAQNFVPKGTQGKVDLQLDADMLKEHGPQLLTTLFRSFTTAILPEDGVTVSVPLEKDDLNPQASAEEEPSGDAADEAGDASDKSAAAAPVEVKLNIDVAGLFRGFLNPKDPGKS